MMIWRALHEYVNFVHGAENYTGPYYRVQALFMYGVDHSENSFPSSLSNNVICATGNMCRILQCTCIVVRACMPARAMMAMQRRTRRGACAAPAVRVLLLLCAVVRVCRDGPPGRIPGAASGRATASAGCDPVLVFRPHAP